jgi:hypothetical protein
MPLRNYLCKCGYQDDRLFHKEYPKSIECPECGGDMDYRLGPVLFRVEFQSGFDTSAGEYFDKKRDRDNWLEKNNRRKVQI